jgi:hypothetical protein
MSFRASSSKIDFSAALERIVRDHESRDIILFDTVSLPRSSSTPTHSMGTPIMKPEKRMKTTIHANVSRPLPSLDDTSLLRETVNELERESIDLDLQIQLVENAIIELKSKFETLSARNETPMKSPSSPRRTPGSRRGRPTTPPEYSPAERAEFWKRKYERAKKRLDGLNCVLDPTHAQKTFPQSN